MNIIQKHEKQGKGEFNKYEIYIYLFYLRVLHFMIERPNFLHKFIKSHQLHQLLSKLEVNINTPLIVVYLYHSIDIIFTLLKKIKNHEVDEDVESIIISLKDNLKERCIKTIN